MPSPPGMTITSVTLTSAGTEYSIALPENTCSAQFYFEGGGTEVRVYAESGGSEYMPFLHTSTWTIDQKDILSRRTIYFKGTTAGAVVRCLYFTDTN